MTVFNKASLQSFFEQGDVPSGTNYADFIDSCVNMAETTVQAIAGPINPTELIAAQVSAGNGVFTGGVRIDGMLSAANVTLSDVTVSGINATRIGVAVLSAGIIGVTTINLVGNMNSTGNISASAASVYASAGRFTSGLVVGTATVSAAGTSQGTAAPLTAVINRGKGVVDGTTTGYALRGNEAGQIKYLFNEGVSANLWPPVGGTINGLAANAAFSLATSSSYTIFGITASAYGVT